MILSIYFLYFWIQLHKCFQWWFPDQWEHSEYPKWSAIEINDRPIPLRWNNHKVHAYGTAHMFPMHCLTWALLHSSEECGWRLSGTGLLNQPNYLGPGTSAAYRLHSPNISGTCLAPNPIGCRDRVQLTPLCVIQHEGPSQMVSSSFDQAVSREFVSFMPLPLGLLAA